ncbi:acetolactate synthase large subunit [Microbispora sp. CA-102843]|uniref:acetolactate synthase large subunit n=1 Tax=Microbispora sp. CA-102843 TaxID=3239952 RepID=UPI003D94307E
MNGAQALIRTLADSGVDVCFANPGTSEMHFVAALDHVPEMRGVLCLFEGVATGAADGYGRMLDRPAAALLHLGPGLGNGLANLHNARRAHTPLLAVVGDHATYHKRFDAPLESDIEAVARSVSGWVRRTARSADLAADAAEAVAAATAPPGQTATLILPADVSWSEGARPAAPISVRPPALVTDGAVADAAAALAAGPRCVLLLGGRALRGPALRAAARIVHATGARVYAETFPARQQRGAGIPAVARLAYRSDAARAQLDGAEHLVLVGARPPVGFFAYPGEQGDLRPQGCTTHVLAGGGEDVTEVLERLAERIGARQAPPVRPARGLAVPEGALTADTLAATVAALLPEDPIVSDESITASAALVAATADARPHDWLSLSGGAIGQGMPLATGAALAAPGRAVVNLEADGSAMYTLPALWTQAREGLDVTTVILGNGSYEILSMELEKVGAVAEGEAARRLLDLSSPSLDFVALATGMGVPATRAHTAGEFAAQFRTALAEPGPHLIEARIRPRASRV